jgi:hypothetical protein
MEKVALTTPNELAGRLGSKIGDTVEAAGKSGSKTERVGQKLLEHPKTTGYGAAGLGAAALGGGALALKKLLSKKKTIGSRLVGAMKKNRKALAIGGGAAAGVGGLAAYKSSKK